MKVKDLTEQLSKFDPELDVRIWADHGQHDMPTSTVTRRATEENEYRIESSYDSVEDYYREYGEGAPDPYVFVSISE